MTSSSASTKTAPSLKKLFKSLGGAYEMKSLHDQF